MEHPLEGFGHCPTEIGDEAHDSLLQIFKGPELDLGDGRVLDGDPGPDEDWPVYYEN